jgi:hypothetical protein
MLCDHGKSGTGSPRSFAVGVGAAWLVGGVSVRTGFIPPIDGVDGFTAVGVGHFVECTIADPFIGVLLFGDAHHRASASSSP